jgi:hypothetical protein
MYAERGESWTIRSAAIDAGNSVGAVGEIEGMHAVDVDQQDKFDAAIAVGSSRGRVSGRKSQRQGAGRYA